MTLPNGYLTASEIVRGLAVPLADEDGFVPLNELLGKMKALQDEGDGMPADLRSDEVVHWLELLSRIDRLAPRAGRLDGGEVKTLPDLEDNQMMVRLSQRLHPKEVDFMLGMSLFEGSMLYWQVLHHYQNQGFTVRAAEQIRQWARSKFRGWPRDLTEPSPWLR